MPIFLHYLGPDAFGLLGVYTLLQAWFSILDLGMSPMLSRAFAQQEHNDSQNKRLINLLRSVEILLLLPAIFLTFIGCIYSNKLAKSWLDSDVFTTTEIGNILKLFFIMIFFRFFESIYKSSLTGMQKHVLINTVITVLSCLKTLTSILLLMFVTTNVDAFFQVQLLFGMLTTTTFLGLVYNSMPQSMKHAKFSLKSLSAVYKFSLGLAGITLLSLCLTQLDKLMLAKFLSLENFGYYTLSASVASILHLLISPISITLGPKLAAYQKKNDWENFQQTFLFGAEFIALIVCTVGGLIIVFSLELLTFWIVDSEVAVKTYQICSLLLLGNILNAMMWMPFQAQIACAWSSLSLKTNLVSIIILVPCNYFFIPIYGAHASAIIWIIINTGYVLIGSSIMFSKILMTARWHWILSCVLKPILIGLSVPIVGKILFTLSKSTIIAVVQLAILAMISALIIIISSKSLRTTLFQLNGRA